ncbi:hypothetical protein CC80DRAFT_430057 [Byssothecium circinans]|uniref:Uncharacterized protein n=1 Tax=Byssothecium circinans TaxID=147558 RepID=A0A6A5TBH8_9PLEO|nr:hypothetical protein CC80DRAFT_430057 [Byssothecium circinans]
MVPGVPHMRLDGDAMHNFLDKEIGTPILDELHDRLWLFSTRSVDNIDPLHRQKIKGRQIIPCDDPNLHLAWTRHTIYIKPLPACLLNHAFWAEHLEPASEMAGVPMSRINKKAHRRAAVGFLKSYAYLVQSPTDFTIAKQTLLFPEFVDITWHQWALFINRFLELDAEVSLRFRFGQLRLNRLSVALLLFRPPSASNHWYYARLHWSTTAIIEHSFANLLFVFASLALALQSMQVALGVPAGELGFAADEATSFQPMKRVFWISSIAILSLSGICWAIILIYPIVEILIQFCWAVSNQRKAA